MELVAWVWVQFPGSFVNTVCYFLCVRSVCWWSFLFYGVEVFSHEYLDISITVFAFNRLADLLDWLYCYFCLSLFNRCWRAAKSSPCQCVLWAVSRVVMSQIMSTPGWIRRDTACPHPLTCWWSIEALPCAGPTVRAAATCSFCRTAMRRRWKFTSKCML